MARTKKRIDLSSAPPETHPPYKKMVEEAIEALNEEDGSSKESISAYLIDTYHITSPDHPNNLRLQLKELVRDHVIGVNVIVKIPKNPPTQQSQDHHPPEKMAKNYFYFLNDPAPRGKRELDTTKIPYNDDKRRRPTSPRPTVAQKWVARKLKQQQLQLQGQKLMEETGRRVTTSPFISEDHANVGGEGGDDGSHGGVALQQQLQLQGQKLIEETGRRVPTSPLILEDRANVGGEGGDDGSHGGVALQQQLQVQGQKLMEETSRRVPTSPLISEDHANVGDEGGDDGSHGGVALQPDSPYSPSRKWRRLKNIYEELDYKQGRCMSRSRQRG